MKKPAFKPLWSVRVVKKEHFNKKARSATPEEHFVAELIWDFGSKSYATKTGVLAEKCMKEIAAWLNKRKVEPKRGIKTLVDGWHPNKKHNDPAQLLLPT